MNLPGSDALLRNEVLRKLERAGARGLESGEIERVLGKAKGVSAALEDLQAEGAAVEWARRWFAMKFTEWLAGRLESFDADGAGRVRGLVGRSRFFAVPRRELKGALQGDTVLLRLAKQSRSAGTQDEKASIVRILARRHATMVGRIVREGENKRFAPFDTRIVADLSISGIEQIEDHCYVVVELVDTSSKNRSNKLEARILEVLGRIEEPGVDVLVILRHHGIPDQYPVATLDQATSLPSIPLEKDFVGRSDLRDVLTVTIDGPTAKDFDDAISLSINPDGGFRLGVHIADVAHYVAEGSALDLEAYRRGTSVYYPETAIAMLPEALSNGLCSLRPDEDRLALSVFLEFTSEGEMSRRSFSESVIRSSRRLTYGEVADLLGADGQPGSRDYGDIVPMLRNAKKLMGLLLSRRSADGALDLDIPSGEIVLGPDGATVGVRAAERTVAHRMIEEFMIAANEAVATELSQADSDSIYRNHEPPTEDEIEELQPILESLGIDPRKTAQLARPQGLQAVLNEVAGQPEEALISTLVLRSMKQALYVPDSRGHFALAREHYTHFTSPIRRYPDLVVHRRLKAHIHGRAEAEASKSHLRRRLPAITEHCCRTERRAEASERDLKQWKLVRWMASRVGEEFDGRVTGVQPFGLFVQLDEFFVDGLVPIRSLADDFYQFEPETHRLVGSSRQRAFRLADRVRVIVAAAESGPRGLELKIAGMPEPRRRRRQSDRTGSKDRRRGRSGGRRRR